MNMSLMAIQDYSEDSGDESETRVTLKVEKISINSSSAKRTLSPPSNARENVPPLSTTVHVTNSTANQGATEEIPSKRVRTFEHEVGIWSSIFYVPYPNYKELCNLLEPYIQNFKAHGYNLCEDFHVSLSKTLILKHFMINAVFLSMKPIVFSLKSAECFLAGVKPYQNEEKTTSFLALTVVAGSNLLDRFVDLIDQRVCDIYQLPKYYLSRDYHMSIFWKNGPIDDQSYRMAKELDKILDQNTAQQGNMFFSAPYDDLLNFDIEEIVFKSGCKLMALPLANIV